MSFGFGDIARLATRLEPTKGNLVSTVGCFYDPMGFLSPVGIRFKVLFQQLCKENQDWDQLLSRNLLRKWNALASELQRSYF